MLAFKPDTDKCPLTEKDMVKAITRALDIGDTRLARTWIDGAWGAILKEAAEPFPSALATARQRLAEMLDHEAKFGQFSLLDRSAPEIVEYEQRCRWNNVSSAYRIPVPDAFADSSGFIPL